MMDDLVDPIPANELKDLFKRYSDDDLEFQAEQAFQFRDWEWYETIQQEIARRQKVNVE